MICFMNKVISPGLPWLIRADLTKNVTIITELQSYFVTSNFPFSHISLFHLSFASEIKGWNLTFPVILPHH